MEWWEVNFLQHHFNKYVVFKIRTKCHHQSTQHVPPRPGFVRCCTNASRHEACLLDATVRQQWHTHACIHSYTYREKADTKERSAAEKRKEGKRSPEACALMKASKTGPDSARRPREGWRERSKDSLPCTCSTWAPPSALLWPCPALYSLGLRRQDPSISWFGPAGVECVTRGRLKALDHMKWQGYVWESVIQAITDDASASRLTVSLEITSAHFLQ